MMSHLSKIYAVCKFSYFRQGYRLKYRDTDSNKSVDSLLDLFCIILIVISVMFIECLYCYMGKIKFKPNSVDLDEVAHDEPPQQDLCCLQIQLFSSLVFKE